MGKNFARLRKKTRLVSALLAVLAGLGIGIVVLAGSMLVMKSTATSIGFLNYIFAACAMLVSVPLFLVGLLPSDKCLAKRLDEEHNLHEKTRTMIALRDESDPFAVLQREDADEKLGTIKYSPWRRGPVVTVAVIVVLSLALLITALVIPSRTEEQPPEVPMTAFDKQFLLLELSELIKDVEESLVAEPLKNKTLDALVSLRSFVETHEYTSEMKLEAIKTVLVIDAALEDENTALPIGKELAACATAALAELGAELSKLNGTGVQKKLGQLGDTLTGIPVETVRFVADELLNAIEVSGADIASPLTALLKNLEAALRGCANSNASTIDGAFGTAEADVSYEVMAQNLNRLNTETVVSRLCNLFGITRDDLVNAGADEDITVTPPAQRPPDEETDEGEDNEKDEIGSGGIGSGDRVYGSNDMIYNPYTNEYVPYGQLFDEYNNRVLQMMEDGRIPPSFEAFTKEYFRSLSEYQPEE